MTVIRGTSWIALCGLLFLHAWMVSERAIGQPAILHFIEVNDANGSTDRFEKKNILPGHEGNPPGDTPIGQTSTQFTEFNRLVDATSTRTSRLIENVRNARFKETRLRLVSDLVDDSGFDCLQVPWVLDSLPFREERQVARAWIKEQLYRCSWDSAPSP